MLEMATGAYQQRFRAEDAIRDIFELKARESLDPDDTKCLSLVKKGDRGCTVKDAMLKKPARCDERRELLRGLLNRSASEDPKTFKSAVMRFVELAVCHRYHINKMQDAAEDWFTAQEVAAAEAAPKQVSTAVVTRDAQLQGGQLVVRHNPTSAICSIEMRKYIRGRDEEQLRELVDRPLSRGEVKRGQVYITVSSDVPGYVKIGYTTLTLEERFRNARRDCGINIELKYTTGLLPHAKRLEAIVHAELADYRYRFANPCKLCKTAAKKRHEEWFQTTVEHAKYVAEIWKEWLIKGIYDLAERSLAIIHRDQVRLSASPESIKRRARLSSPELARPSSPLQIAAPPASPSPEPKKILRTVEKVKISEPAPSTREDGARASAKALPSTKLAAVAPENRQSECSGIKISVKKEDTITSAYANESSGVVQSIKTQDVKSEAVPTVFEIVSSLRLGKTVDTVPPRPAPANGEKSTQRGIAIDNPAAGPVAVDGSFYSNSPILMPSKERDEPVIAPLQGEMRGIGPELQLGPGILQAA